MSSVHNGTFADVGQHASQDQMRLCAMCCTQSDQTFGNMLHKILYDFGQD